MRSNASYLLALSSNRIDAKHRCKAGITIQCLTLRSRGFGSWKIIEKNEIEKKKIPRKRECGQNRTRCILLLRRKQEKERERATERPQAVVAFTRCSSQRILRSMMDRSLLLILLTE